jgi:hypothetical protein
MVFLTVYTHTLPCMIYVCSPARNACRRYRIVTMKADIHNFVNHKLKYNNMIFITYTRPFRRYLLDIHVLEAISIRYKSEPYFSVICYPLATASHQIPPTSSETPHQLAERNSTNKNSLSARLSVSHSVVSPNHSAVVALRVSLSVSEP